MAWMQRFVKPISYKRHRFPADVIRQAVWLYYGFTLRFGDVEELLAQRGVEVSYDTLPDEDRRALGEAQPQPKRPLKAVLEMCQRRFKTDSPDRGCCDRRPV